MRTYIIKVILDDKVLQTVRVDANTQDQAETIAFKWADNILGINENYELYFVGHPRHDILFKGVQ